MHSLRERQQALLVKQPVETGVTLATNSNETSNSEGVEVSSVDALFAHLANVQLDSRMLLGRDEAIRGRTLPREVKVNNLALVVLHCSPG
mmetsp:Transcript_106763/g.212025  ORF Transcript_106763/g.212025 Transcript_106763/m.212025 type:complete len:90 (-) Transcript_106763:77-346(-)